MYLTKIAQKVWAEYYDPYANDQDWGLYYYLVVQEG